MISSVLIQEYSEQTNLNQFRWKATIQIQNRINQRSKSDKTQSKKNKT